LKFYNLKSKASRLSNLDDNLIAEAMSAISALPGVPRSVGAASSPSSGKIGAHTSSEVVLIRANRVPPTRGFLRREFLRLSSSVVIQDYSLEPVHSSLEAMGLVCRQA
jgi:hypothetical protein